MTPRATCLCGTGHPRAHRGWYGLVAGGGWLAQPDGMRALSVVHDRVSIQRDALGTVTMVVTTLRAQPCGPAARKWSERNRGNIHHPLAPALRGWLARFIDKPNHALPGDHQMPRVAAPGFGASERHAVAPGDEAHGTLGMPRGSMPGGQSDNPLSPYFGAGHEDRVKGRAAPLLPGPVKHTLSLTAATRRACYQ